MTRTFAWVRGLRGPEAQIITDVAPSILDPKKMADRVLAQIEIDETISLDDCIARYPAPTVSFL